MTGVNTQTSNISRWNSGSFSTIVRRMFFFDVGSVFLVLFVSVENYKEWSIFDTFQLE